jgi:hypothetical protein
MDPALTDEEERFMRWLEEDDVTGHHAGEGPVPENWHALKQNVDQLSDLLRSNIPATREPPASDTFNEEVRRNLG